MEIELLDKILDFIFCSISISNIFLIIISFTLLARKMHKWAFNPNFYLYGWLFPTLTFTKVRTCSLLFF